MATSFAVKPVICRGAWAPDRATRASLKRAAVASRLTSPVLGLRAPLLGHASASRGRRTVSVRAESVEQDTKADSKTEVESTEVCDPVCSVDDLYGESLVVKDYKAKDDMIKAIGVGTGLSVLVGLLNQGWVVEHESAALIAVFLAGYVGIILEEELAFNKSGVGLVMAVSLWTIRSLSGDADVVNHDLAEALADVSEIIFFLMGAMTIVEIVDAHQGFKIVTDNIKTNSNKTLLWIVGTITFFMSAVLDNLTSTIVMVSLLRKLVKDPDRRMFFGAVVVIAANAGGAWTPIGDVTTTMLWINGNISTVATMRDIILPSVVSLAIPLTLMSFLAEEAQGEVEPMDESSQTVMAPRGTLIFGVGLASLLFVPFFKATTGLPPYLGMLGGLGALWLLTDALHYKEPERSRLRVPDALSRIDSQGVLFFLGILMSIACLDDAGLLKDLAVFLDDNVPSQEIIATIIGLASAVIDNVPLVAATMGMYDIAQYPQDDQLWQLIAFCAGTGGSILVIGSAAGVAFMGMEKVDFMWYVRKVSPWALAGYLGGIGVYLAGASLRDGGAAIAALPPPM